MTLSDHGLLENILFNLLFSWLSEILNPASRDVNTLHSGTYPLHEDDGEVPVECRNYITIYILKPLRLESVSTDATKSVVF